MVFVLQHAGIEVIAKPTIHKQIVAGNSFPDKSQLLDQPQAGAVVHVGPDLDLVQPQFLEPVAKQGHGSGKRDAPAVAVGTHPVTQLGEPVAGVGIDQPGVAHMPIGPGVEDPELVGGPFFPGLVRPPDVGQLISDIPGLRLPPHPGPQLSAGGVDRSEDRLRIRFLQRPQVDRSSFQLHGALPRRSIRFLFNIDSKQRKDPRR